MQRLNRPQTDRRTRRRLPASHRRRSQVIRPEAPIPVRVLRRPQVPQQLPRLHRSLYPHRIARVQHHDHRYCITRKLRRMLRIRHPRKVSRLRIYLRHDPRVRNQLLRSRHRHLRYPLAHLRAKPEEPHQLHVIPPSAPQRSVRLLLIFHPPLRQVQHLVIPLPHRNRPLRRFTRIRAIIVQLPLLRLRPAVLEVKLHVSVLRILLLQLPQHLLPRPAALRPLMRIDHVKRPRPVHQPLVIKRIIRLQLLQLRLRVKTIVIRISYPRPVLYLEYRIPEQLKRHLRLDDLVIIRMLRSLLFHHRLYLLYQPLIPSHHVVLRVPQYPQPPKQPRPRIRKIPVLPNRLLKPLLSLAHNNPRRLPHRRWIYLNPLYRVMHKRMTQIASRVQRLPLLVLLQIPVVLASPFPRQKRLHRRLLPILLHPSPIIRIVPLHSYLQRLSLHCHREPHRKAVPVRDLSPLPAPPMLRLHVLSHQLPIRINLHASQRLPQISQVQDHPVLPVRKPNPKRHIPTVLHLIPRQVIRQPRVVILLLIEPMRLRRCRRLRQH